ATIANWFATARNGVSVKSSSTTHGRKAIRRSLTRWQRIAFSLLNQNRRNSSTMHKQATRALRKTVRTRAGAKSLPQKHFVSQEIYAAEHKRIFANEWLLVGHQSQIPNAGDYIVQT